MIIGEKTNSADWIYSEAQDSWFTIVPHRGIGPRRVMIRWIGGSECFVRSGWLARRVKNGVLARA